MTDPADTARVALTTVPDEECARALSRRLVEEGVAGCVHRLALRSSYRWQGEIRDDAEFLLVMKTTPERLADLEREVHAGHPYEVPEFLVLEVASGSASYLAWLRQAVAQ